MSWEPQAKRKGELPAGTEVSDTAGRGRRWQQGSEGAACQGMQIVQWTQEGHWLQLVAGAQGSPLTYEFSAWAPQ